MQVRGAVERRTTHSFVGSLLYEESDEVFVSYDGPQVRRALNANRFLMTPDGVSIACDRNLFE